MSRWWPSKGDVLLEALARKADVHIALPDEGSWAADLPASVTAGFAADVVFGVVWYRLLAVPQPFDRRLANRLVALLTAGA
jgi:hypothetical protein